MNKTYIEDKTFNGNNFLANKLPKADYENCNFINCNFSNSDLSSVNFIDCEFESCDLSMAKLIDTSFNNVYFKSCKLLGLHFDDCNKFSLSFSFDNCIINLSSFYKLKIQNTKFLNCELQEVDFTETNLTLSILNGCDLSKAVFENTIIEKTDFRTSYNYSIDPNKNKIKKAKFSINEITGLLDKYDIIIK